jgi:hypothetical protein
MMNAAGSIVGIPSHQSGVLGVRSVPAQPVGMLIVEWIEAELPHPLHAVSVDAQSERAIRFQN